MVSVGIDFGNDSCYLTAVRGGGIEPIANDYSEHATPSCVAFSERKRIIGVGAKLQMPSNILNTIHSFKRLLARKYNDPYVVEQKTNHLPFELTQIDDGWAGIKVLHLGRIQVFTPEQITAMLLTKLKDTLKTTLKTEIFDCVISVPPFFTQAERVALRTAASIAGLNVLRLLNDTTATALGYGFYKVDLPPPKKKPRNVIFVDFGHSSLKVTAVEFYKGSLKILACACDPFVGGRNFDIYLSDHFGRIFNAKFGVDAKSSPRAFLKLVTAVEKTKKDMTVNPSKLYLNIQDFMEGKDVLGEIDRTEMEKICEPLLMRVEEKMKECLVFSGLQKEDIHSVEMVGGSSRIHAVKRLVEAVFGKPPSLTLNQDEVVAQGCAVMCAMLSPTKRVEPFVVMDLQNYPVKLTWEQGATVEWALPQIPFPCSYKVAIELHANKIKTPFNVQAVYADWIPYHDPHIGTLTIEGLDQNKESRDAKFEAGVDVDLDGIIKFVSLSLLREGSVKSSGYFSKSKAQPVNVDWPFTIRDERYSQEQLLQLYKIELDLMAVDNTEKDRLDARNSLENYVYKLKSKMSPEGELAPYVSESFRNDTIKSLTDTETWLEGEGENCDRKKYDDYLQSWKRLMDPFEEQRKVMLILQQELGEVDALSALLETCRSRLQGIKRTLEEGQQQNVAPTVTAVDIYEEISKFNREVSKMTKTTGQRLSSYVHPSDTSVTNHKPSLI